MTGVDVGRHPGASGSRERITRSAGVAHSIIGTAPASTCGALVGEVIAMPRPSTDRSGHSEELHLVACALATHHGRQTLPIVDVDHWLDENSHRRTGALVVVWDRTDAAILSRDRPDLEVTTAAPRLDWARRWARETGHGDIPGQEPRSSG